MRNDTVALSVWKANRRDGPLRFAEARHFPRAPLSVSEKGRGLDRLTIMGGARPLLFVIRYSLFTIRSFPLHWGKDKTGVNDDQFRFFRKGVRGRTLCFQTKGFPRGLP